LASLKDRKDRQGNGKLKMISTWIEDNNGDRINNVMTGMTVSICVEYEMMNEKNVEEISVAYSIDALNNLEISVLSNVYTGDIFRKYLPRKGIIRCQINRLVLNRGIYTYNIMMREKNNDILDYITIAGKINVTEGDYFGTGKIIPETSLVFMEHKWKIYPSTE
jgi:lipopolysaccharide transport system ATP-binding protein